MRERKVQRQNIGKNSVKTMSTRSKTKPPRQVLKTNQGAMRKGKTYPKAQHSEDQ